ncbi:unnamed protein product [Sympodiomycopsis kandeliae]
MSFDEQEQGGSRQEFVRPSLKQLNEAANYDADSLEWPASASVSRGVAPPSIGASSKTKQKTTADGAKSQQKTVRIAPPTEDDIRYYQPPPKAREELAQPAFQQQWDPSHNTDDMTPGRFVLPLEGGEGHEPASGSQSSSNLPAMPLLPMVGGVQERRSLIANKAAASASKALPSGASRFKALKEAERANSVGGTGSERAGPSRLRSVPTVQSRPKVAPQTHERAIPPAQKDVQVLSSEDAEEWLDEQGNVMSAFRKSRLQRMGQEPPGGKRYPPGHTHVAAHDEANEADRPHPEPASLTDGDEDIATLRAEISRENDAKLKSMNPEDVAQDLKDLQDIFGRDSLEALKNRSNKNKVQKEEDVDTLMRDISRENTDKLKGMSEQDVQDEVKGLESVFDKDLLEGLRNRVNQSKASLPSKQGDALPSKQGGALPSRQGDASQPAEVPAPPSGSDEKPEESGSHSSSVPSPLERLLFDSTGKLLPVPSIDMTHHHHCSSEGDHSHDHPHPQYGADPSDPNREGYTTSSLLLLCRSTIPGQRIMALNMASRVCSIYGSHLALGDKTSDDKLQLESGSIPSLPVVATLLVRGKVHLDTALTSIMLLNDRQRSVRHSALSTLRTCLLFGNFTSGQKGAEIATKLLQGSLLLGLNNVLQDVQELSISRELVIQILLQLISVEEVSVADSLIRFEKGKLISSLVSACLKVHWPPSNDQASSSLRPATSCITLLHKLIISSRSNAHTLVQRDVFDGLLRFLAAGPWVVVGSSEEKNLTHRLSFNLLSETLKIYYSLARYGMYASLVSRAWDLFQGIQSWIREESFSAWKRNTSQVAQQFYCLLSIWTVCAIDPHQTTPEHEVTWTQVETWIDFTLDLLVIVLSREKSQIDFDLLTSLGQHIQAWLDCAAKNGPQQRGVVAQRLSEIFKEHQDKLQNLFEDLSDAKSKVDHEQEDSSDEGDAEDGPIAGTKTLVTACKVFEQFTAIAQSIQDDDLLTGLKAPVEHDDELQSRALALLQGLDDRLDRWSVIQFLIFCSSSFKLEKQTLLTLLSNLRPREEEQALQVIDLLLKTAAEDRQSKSSADNTSKTFSCLRPFFMECLGIRPNPDTESKRLLEYAPSIARCSDLKRVQSLRLPQPSAADSEEGEEKDPVTGSALWTCPASRGLALRCDWPLLCLDDLLRSGDCSVFNRANNLPVDWDPNEREVVQASLEFTNWCLTSSTLPHITSTHLYLAAQKVFMLEAGIQGDLRKWTGALTGKDLFRDATIVPHLSILITVHATRLSMEEQQCTPIPTFDEISPNHFGTETSYYSFYTDLIGLYDSISFGNELFSIVLLPPLSNTYPIDYRRLIWKDYSHLLPSINQILIKDCPAGGIQRFLSTETRKKEEDVKGYTEETEMLHAYTSALLQGRLQNEHGVMFAIAIHHIALALWDQAQMDQRAKSLARAVFSQASMQIQQIVLEYHRASQGDDAEGRAYLVEGRKEMLKSQCGITTE